MPIEEGNVIPRPVRGDPLETEHWCRECDNAFSQFYTEEREELQKMILSKTEARFRAWLKDKFK